MELVNPTSNIFSTGNESGEYDDKDSKLMPPPSWLPKTVKTEEDGRIISPEKSSPKTYHTPLGSLRPPELADVDVTDLFPEFRPGQVSYISEIFLFCPIKHIT